jgi:hypothetical protein
MDSLRPTYFNPGDPRPGVPKKLHKENEDISMPKRQAKVDNNNLVRTYQASTVTGTVGLYARDWLLDNSPLNIR